MILWQNEWGYKAFFSCENSRRAVVAILFNNNFDFVLNKDYADPDGRFIILDIKTADLKKKKKRRQTYVLRLLIFTLQLRTTPIIFKMLITAYSNLVEITSSWVEIST